MTGFSSLGVLPELVAVLQRHDIVEPFPIQTLSLPDALAGRDILGRGRTGSGKTIAFGLPIVTRLLEQGGRSRPHHPRALVLVPTRELAVQVNQTLAFLARAVGLRTMTVYGGVTYGPQLSRLNAGVDIMIATPGRLEDLIARGVCDLSEVSIAVLDEADMMADMGFLPSVMRLLGQTEEGGQRMLFSATLDGEVARVVATYLVDPVEHAVAQEEALAIEHRVFLVTRDNKVAVLADLVSGEGRSLVFSRTKHGATKLAHKLTVAGIPATELHGDLRQPVRQRNLDAFASGKVRVLVATDVAARGIHVDDIALVVHCDPPTDPKAFLHRSGRTARAGASGVVVTFCQKDQNRAVKELTSAAKIKPIRDVVEPGSDVIALVRGPVASPPPGMPADAASKQPPRPRNAERDNQAARPAGQRKTDSAGAKGGPGREGKKSGTAKAWGRSETSSPQWRPGGAPRAGGRSRSAGSRRGR